MAELNTNRRVVVCVIGSAILVPIAWVVLALLTGVAMYLVGIPSVKLWPKWLQWTWIVAGLIVSPFWARDVYRWFFNRCQRHANE